MRPAAVQRSRRPGDGEGRHGRRAGADHAERLRRAAQRKRRLNPGAPVGVPRRRCDGGALRAARDAAGLSQEALAARSGVAVSTIHRIEADGRERPYPHTLRHLAEALVVAPAELTA